MAAIKLLVTEFKLSWKSYIVNFSKYEEFLSSLSLINQKSVKVLNDYRGFSNITAQGLSQENPSAIIIGTLSVISGSVGLEYKPAIDSFLGGIKSIGSNFEGVVYDEPELGKISCALKTMLSTSDFAHTLLNEDTSISPASDKVINSKVYMKLAFKTYELFPVLRSVPVDLDVVEKCIQCMIKLELWTPVVKLAEIYYDRLTVIHLQELMREMSDKGEWDKCADLLCLEQQPTSTPGQAFEPSDVRTPMVQDFIQRCMDFGDSKSLGAAGRVADKYKLGGIVQEITSLSRNLKIEGFVRKGRWQLGEQLAFKRVQQMHLFHCLVQAHMFEEADEMFHKFKLLGQVEQVSAGQREQQRISQQSTYLALPVPPERVVVVHDLSTLNLAFQVLGLQDLNRRQTGEAVSEMSCPLLVGVDVEWRAEILRKGLTSRAANIGASLLQVATASDIFLFDLPALARPATRTRSLVLLQLFFESPDIVKLVWSFDKSDLRMLRQAANGAFKSAFSKPKGVLELCNVFGGGSKGNLPSLSTACQQSLGRPLNKSQQTSNWEQRPLSASQVQYAALDAHCLLGILAANSIDTDCGLDSIRQLYSPQQPCTPSTPVGEAEPESGSRLAKRKLRSWRDLQRVSKRPVDDSLVRDDSEGATVAMSTQSLG